MPENTEYDPLPVAGYSRQSPESIEAVNRNKRHEELLLRQIDSMLRDQFAFDGRWLAIARTHLEIGFMALNRAIFKPKRIELPDSAINLKDGIVTEVKP